MRRFFWASKTYPQFNAVLEPRRIQGGQSRDTHVVILQDLFTFCARLKVVLTIFLGFWLSAELTPSAEYPD